MKNILETLTTEQKQDIVVKQLKRLRASEAFYRDYFENWKIYYKVYRAIKDEAAQFDEPNEIIPIAYSIVEDAVARLAVPLLQKLPIFVKAKNKKYEKNAENFYKACKDYFGSAAYRLDRIKSEREFVITGNAWEVYEWRHDILKGKEWTEEEVLEDTEVPIEFFGKTIFKQTKKMPIKRLVEKEKDYTELIGPYTRFPSVFCMYPEPGVKKFENLNWVIEIEENVPLTDLEKAIYIDPITHEKKPLYDLTELFKENDRNKIRPIKLNFNDASESIFSILTGKDIDEAQEADPAVCILRIYQKDNSIITIAQGKYVISYMADVYHYPKMPLQLRGYTQSNEELFSIGIIEPILTLLYEINDIHNMSFQNWIRIINKMVVYDESVIKHPEDFKPRAGGKIRANLLAGGDVSKAFATVDQPDVSVSMINMESQTMGKIEKTIAISDLSPGTMGTRAYHKTYGGLMEIQEAFAKRFSIMMMTNLAYLTNHMEFMYWLFMQFMWESIPVTTTEKGIFKTENFNREDFNSGGEGFLFLQVPDPSFGDTSVQRNQLMVLFDQTLKYEQHRMATLQQRRVLGEPPLKIAHVDEAYERVLESFSTADINSLLSTPYNVMSPKEEFTFLLKGLPIQVNARENLIEHLLEHSLQREELIKMENEKGANPILMQALLKHIEETKAAIATFTSNADMLAKARQIETESLQNPNPEIQNSALKLTAGNIGGIGQVNRPIMPMGGNNGSGVPQPEMEA